MTFASPPVTDTAKPHPDELPPDIVFSLTDSSGEVVGYLITGALTGDVQAGGQTIPPNTDNWFWNAPYNADNWPTQFTATQIDQAPASLDPVSNSFPSVEWNDQTTEVPADYPGTATWQVIKVQANNAESFTMGFVQFVSSSEVKWYKTGSPEGQWTGEELPTDNVAYYEFNTPGDGLPGGNLRYLAQPVS